MIEIFMVIFIIMGVIGLVGTVYVYAQPSANNWCVIYVLMLIVGVVGILFTMTLIIFSTGG